MKKCEIKNGKQKTVNEKWQMENGKWKMVNGKCSIEIKNSKLKIKIVNEKSQLNKLNKDIQLINQLIFSYYKCQSQYQIIILFQQKLENGKNHSDFNVDYDEPYHHSSWLKKENCKKSFKETYQKAFKKTKRKFRRSSHHLISPSPSSIRSRNSRMRMISLHHPNQIQNHFFSFDSQIYLFYQLQFIQGSTNENPFLQINDLLYIIQSIVSSKNTKQTQQISLKFFHFIKYLTLVSNQYLPTSKSSNINVKVSKNKQNISKLKTISQLVKIHFTLLNIEFQKIVSMCSSYNLINLYYLSDWEIIIQQYSILVILIFILNIIAVMMDYIEGEPILNNKKEVQKSRTIYLFIFELNYCKLWRNNITLMGCNSLLIYETYLLPVINQLIYSTDYLTQINQKLYFKF